MRHRGEPRRNAQESRPGPTAGGEGGEECDGGRKGRDRRGAGRAEDRRTETARRFVTVTRALASSGGERARSGVHAISDLRRVYLPPSLFFLHMRLRFRRTGFAWKREKRGSQ